jgi:MFS family permease
MEITSPAFGCSLRRACSPDRGGNITVAQAYIADITPPDQRSKKMGLIGMAFGLGFIFGPILGGVSLKFLGTTGPGWVAASLCAANFLLACFILVESRKPTSEHVAQRPHLDQWRHTLSEPKIGLLVITFFLATFCFQLFREHVAFARQRQFPSRHPQRSSIRDNRRVSVCELRDHRGDGARRRTGRAVKNGRTKTDRSKSRFHGR